jgi:hypothetical protein
MPTRPHPDLAAHLGPNAPATLAAYQRTVSDGYVDSYSGSAAIDHEHHLDGAALAEVLVRLPDFWAWLRRLAGEGPLAALDTGAGEAAKTLLVARTLAGELGAGRFVLHANESDRRQLTELIAGASRALLAGIETNVLACTLEALLADLATGDVHLDPRPAYVTNIHVAYYLEQKRGLIPVLAALAGLTDGLVCVIVEGPGDLQDMKAHMARERGLATPASSAQVTATFQAAGIPVAPPITIPNRSWQVDRTLPPEVMFDRHFRFLLDGNWGSRPLEPADLEVAGRYFQEIAQPLGQPIGYLDGPDHLIVAGRWLTDHPRDLAALHRIAQQTR